MANYCFDGTTWEIFSDFKVGADWDADVLVLPNGVREIQRWGNTLGVTAGDSGYLIIYGDFTYTNKIKYSVDGYNVFTAAIADFGSQYDSITYDGNTDFLIGTNETTLYINGSYDKDIRLWDRSNGIKNISLIYEYGNNILWGNGLNNSISDGSGNGNLWGSGGDDTLTGGEGSDIFYYERDGGHDFITDAQSNDTVCLFNSNPWETNYYYDNVNNVMHIYAGSGELEVNCSTGDYWYPYTYPVYQFADGTRLTYEPSNNSLNGVSWDAAEDVSSNIAESQLWSRVNTYYGTEDADNFFIDKNNNKNLVFDAAQNDTLHLCDTSLSDIVATFVNDNLIAVQLNTGENLKVFTTEKLSPTFKLASGERYVYSREVSDWQEA